MMFFVFVWSNFTQYSVTEEGMERYIFAFILLSLTFSKALI